MKLTAIAPRVAGVLLIGCVLACPDTYAQRANPNQQEQQTREAQAVSRAVYDKLMLVQQHFDSENYAAGLAVLDDMYRPERLSDYELAQVLQYYALIHNATGDTAAAIAALESILRIPELEANTRTRTTYMLAQLLTADGQYEKALRRLTDWFALEPNPAPATYVLLAQIHYELGQHRAMIDPIETAIRIATSQRKEISESWYSLLSFAYFQIEEYRRVRDIQMTLLEHWPRKQYWSTLAAVNSELGDEPGLYSAYSAAYTQGLLNQEAELVTMAQLYMQQNVPYKAAVLLESELETGRVERSAHNLRLLSQAWTLAQEDERSLPALTEAAQRSDDGELGIRLGNANLNLGRYEDCVHAIQAGIDKGGLRKPENAFISLGMCLYYLRRYDEATAAFGAAAERTSTRSVARQWQQVIVDEVKRNEEIEAAEAAARAQIELLAGRRAERRH